MVYLRTKRIKGHLYLYVVRSVREGNRVRQIFVRYAGPATPANRARAMGRMPHPGRGEPKSAQERRKDQVAKAQARRRRLTGSAGRSQDKYRQDREILGPDAGGGGRKTSEPRKRDAGAGE